MNKTMRWALCAPLLLAAAFSAFSQPAEAEYKAAVEAAQKVQVPGPAEVPLRDQAVLKLPAGTDDTFIGVVFPNGEGNWLATIRYVNDGYIKDDDAKDWNADDLLQNLKDGTEAANEERAKRGIPAIEVAGWAEKPRYDAQSHRLVWSATTRPKGQASSQDLGVNYNTYALGREGFISLNLVTDLKDLDKYKPVAADLLAATQYQDGKRYADFNSSTDKVAAYGLATLVAGAAAKKLGLLAVILAFFAKFAKIIVVAGGAALWGIFKLFGRKKPEPVAVQETEPAPIAPKPPGAA